METGVFQIDLKDGRLFRVFYANSTQKTKLLRQFNSVKDKIDTCHTVTNGIHTVKQFQEHLKTI